MDWNLIGHVANIIFPLLLIFQWLWNISRENATKNNLFGIRRMVSRLGSQEASDILDSIDASLATLGAGRSFVEWTKEVKSFVRIRREKEENVPLSPAPRLDERDETVRRTKR